MSLTPKILAFAGSLRADSFNKRVVRLAAAAAERAGAEVTLLDLADVPLPLFDQDLEAREGLPANGRKLKDLFRAHHGFLIASPEYNSSITAVLKNTIDWVSRPEADRPPLECFTGKVAGIMSASPGALGGLRGLVHLRAILGNINTLVLTEQVAVVKANEAFQPDGSLKDSKLQAGIENIGTKLTDVVRRLG